MKRFVHLISTFGAAAVLSVATGCGAPLDGSEGTAEVGAVEQAVLGDCLGGPSEANCSGADPITTGCTIDSHIVTFAASGTLAAVVRYSPACQSAWAVTADSNTSRKLRVTVADNAGHVYARTGFGTRASLMVYVGNDANRLVQGTGEGFNANGTIVTTVVQTNPVHPN